jgi:hypothetical protein
MNGIVKAAVQLRTSFPFWVVRVFYALNFGYTECTYMKENTVWVRVSDLMSYGIIFKSLVGRLSFTSV